MALLADRIDDAGITEEQLKAAAGELEFGDDPTILRYEPLVENGVNILRENLDYLFSALGRGGKKAVAVKLEIDPTTISRWLHGAFEPQTSMLQRLVDYFGLTKGTDLRRDAVFLTLGPASTEEQRLWVHKKIEALPRDTFQELYPALRRLLENS